MSFINKKSIIAITSILFCISFLFWYLVLSNRPIKVAEDEMLLKIQLDVKEDFGLLIIDYDYNGDGGSGGISNANKSLIKHDETLYFNITKKAFDEPTNIEKLDIHFAIVTKYFEPNYENNYPIENIITMDTISLDGNFGELYSLQISGGFEDGYVATLME